MYAQEEVAWVVHLLSFFPVGRFITYKHHTKFQVPSPGLPLVSLRPDPEVPMVFFFETVHQPTILFSLVLISNS